MAESGLPFTYGAGQDANSRRALEVAFEATPRVQDPGVRQGQVDPPYAIFLLIIIRVPPLATSSTDDCNECSDFERAHLADMVSCFIH